MASPSLCRATKSLLQIRAVAVIFSNPATQNEFQTSSVTFKRKPKSVPIPRWAQALRKRQKVDEILNKPMSERRIAAAQRLAEDTREITFNSTAYRVPENQLTEVGPKREGPRPKLLLSNDKQMVICYHPGRDYPLELTEPLPNKPVWYMTESETHGYDHQPNDEQVNEMQTLVAKDPNVWSVRALSHMLQVQPEAVKKSVRLTDEQRKYLRTEKELLDEMPPKQRIEYRRVKLWEIINYCKETRGLEYALTVKKRMLYRPGFS